MYLLPSLQPTQHRKHHHQLPLWYFNCLKFCNLFSIIILCNYIYYCHFVGSQYSVLLFLLLFCFLSQARTAVHKYLQLYPRYHFKQRTVYSRWLRYLSLNYTENYITFIHSVFLILCTIQK